MQKLEIGKPYTLFQGKNMKNQTGCIFECHKNGELFLNIYINNMTKLEKQSLRFNKIEVRILEESNFLYTLLNFGNNFIFELDFDPTLYKDDRIINIINSNLVHVISIESNNNLIQTLRLVNAPLKLFTKWHTIWINAKDINNYSIKYKNWVFDLQNRYSPTELWEYGKYIGEMGSKLHE